MSLFAPDKSDRKVLRTRENRKEASSSPAKEEVEPFLSNPEQYGAIQKLGPRVELTWPQVPTPETLRFVQLEGEEYGVSEVPRLDAARRMMPYQAEVVLRPNLVVDDLRRPTVLGNSGDIRIRLRGTEPMTATTTGWSIEENKVVYHLTVRQGGQVAYKVDCRYDFSGTATDVSVVPANGASDSQPKVIRTGVAGGTLVELPPTNDAVRVELTGQKSRSDLQRLSPLIQDPSLKRTHLEAAFLGRPNEPTNAFLGSWELKVPAIERGKPSQPETPEARYIESARRLTDARFSSYSPEVQHQLRFETTRDLALYVADLAKNPITRSAENEIVEKSARLQRFAVRLTSSQERPLSPDEQAGLKQAALDLSRAGAKLKFGGHTKLADTILQTADHLLDRTFARGAEPYFQPLVGTTFMFASPSELETFIASYSKLVPQGGMQAQGARVPQKTFSWRPIPGAVDKKTNLPDGEWFSDFSRPDGYTLPASGIAEWANRFTAAQKPIAKADQKFLDRLEQSGIIGKDGSKHYRPARNTSFTFRAQGESIEHASMHALYQEQVAADSQFPSKVLSVLYGDKLPSAARASIEKHLQTYYSHIKPSDPRYAQEVFAQLVDRGHGTLFRGPIAHVEPPKPAAEPEKPVQLPPLRFSKTVTSTGPFTEMETRVNRLSTILAQPATTVSVTESAKLLTEITTALKGADALLTTRETVSQFALQGVKLAQAGIALQARDYNSEFAKSVKELSQSIIDRALTASPRDGRPLYAGDGVFLFDSTSALKRFVTPFVDALKTSSKNGLVTSKEQIADREVEVSSGSALKAEGTSFFGFGIVKHFNYGETIEAPALLQYANGRMTGAKPDGALIATLKQHNLIVPTADGSKFVMPQLLNAQFSTRESFMHESAHAYWKERLLLEGEEPVLKIIETKLSELQRTNRSLYDSIQGSIKDLPTRRARLEEAGAIMFERR